jgi:hypothetical protein
MNTARHRVAASDEQRVRALLEDVYVRDMYVKRDRGAFSREFARCFHMLSPTIDGATGDVTDVRWIGIDGMLANHPKAMLPSVRFEVPWVDVAGHAAVARVDVFDAGEHVFTDYVSLYRVKGAWKLVGKLFHHHRPSVAPGTEPE